MVEPNRPLRVGIWVAVSSKPQASEEKNSLASQEANGREFAAAHGAEIVAVYRVPGYSRDLVLWTEAEAGIPAYRRLREDLEARRLDLLWALDIDRLGRDPALSSQVLSLAERNGAEVYTETAPHLIGHQTIGHRYVTAIQAVRAKEDQARRVSHWYTGMAHRARRGLPHRWPHGYTPTRDPHTGQTTGAEFDPVQIEAVKLITALFLAGVPYEAIADRLNQSAHRPPRAARWNAPGIREMLHSDLYAGFVHWHDIEAEERSPRVPALWDPETHRAIIRERHRRDLGWARRDGTPLAGVAFCVHCGGPMHRVTSNLPAPRLRCSTHTRKHRTGIPCRPNRILESTALAALAEFLTEELTPAAIRAVVSQDDPGAALREELAELHRAIKRLEDQRRRIALDRAQGIMLADAYRTADDDLIERLGRVRGQAEEIRARIAALPDPAARSAQLQDLAAHFSELLETKTPTEIAATLQNAGLGVWIQAGEVAFVDFRE